MLSLLEEHCYGHLTVSRHEDAVSDLYLDYNLLRACQELAQWAVCPHFHKNELSPTL